MSPEERTLIAARGMTDALNGLTERLDRAEKKERRLFITLACVAIALALAVGTLAFFAIRENSSRITSDQRQQAAFQAQMRIACVNTNRARTEAITLWDKVLPGGVPDTPAGHRELVLLEATVARYFAAHNCG